MHDAYNYQARGSLPGIAGCDRHAPVSSQTQTADLGSMIRQARVAKELTQKDLGEKISMGQPAVCGWERNRARPNARTLADLSRVLDLDLGLLTLAAGNPLEYPRGSDGALEPE